MSLLQLSISWYVFIGLVWCYLEMHEYFTARSLKGGWKAWGVASPMILVLLSIRSAAIWPWSLYRHLKNGTLKDLFE